MTDYVAFKEENNEPISVDEYKEQEFKVKINCICGKKLQFVGEKVLQEMVKQRKRLVIFHITKEKNVLYQKK
jgi:hypothetical protein